MKVIIEVHRHGYDTDQIDDTMTVGDLIEVLEQFELDALVYTSHDDGYTFGGINHWDFKEEELEDDEWDFEEEDN